MKILLVEDDPGSRLYLESLLEIHKYDVRSAANGIEGLNIFDEYNPDVVITDIQMPVMDGLELLETIKKRKQETIVIITTAFGTERYAIQALHLGANNYLKKPVTAKDLIPLLKKYKTILFGHPEAKYNDECGVLLERTVKLEFEASIENIPRIIDRLLSETGWSYSDEIRINIELGLVELITNAIEHGSLEISYKEKQEALDNFKLEELYFERENDPKYKGRKIHVDYKFDCKSCQWIITDEGSGFNWNELPDPTDDENLEQLNGRGIFITRFLFDELEYCGKGNVVRAKKYFNTDTTYLGQK